MALTVSTYKKMKDSAQILNNNGPKSTSSGGSSSKSTTSGGTSGSTKTTSSGGGSKTTNSQYTAPTLGNTWNANTDYQAIINQAVKNNDYVTAAKAEQLRNQKIYGLGGNYNTTNTYLSYLPDLVTHGQQQMANKANWQDVLATYNARNYKASTTDGLGQYSNDEIQQAMWDYINTQMKAESQQDAQDQFNQWVDEYNQNNPKEEYQGKYDKRIDALLNEILNRDDFSYDAMNDPLYQQYAAMYQREGERAMKNTMAEAAAGAGGMNTYAITAAQQANSYYNSQLNDRIPELYQLAYNMYLQDKESKVQDLGILQNMDATQYNRYRDTIQDYYADKNFAYGAYTDAVQQGNWLTNQNYNSMVDNRNWNNDQYWANKEWNYNDEWKNKEYTDNRADIEYERTQAEEDEAKALIDWYIQNGVTTVDPETLAKAGVTQAQFNEMVAYKKQQDAEAKSNGSKGGSSSSSSKKKSSDEVVIDRREDGKEEEQIGLTPYKNEEYAKIEKACEEYASQGDKWKAAACAKSALDNGVISQEEYNKLLAKYNPMLDITLGGVVSPEKVFN